MLMYRQVSRQRNCKIHELPLHIMKLFENIKKQEEKERKRKEDEKNTCKVQSSYHEVNLVLQSFTVMWCKHTVTVVLVTETIIIVITYFYFNLVGANPGGVMDQIIT